MDKDTFTAYIVLAVLSTVIAAITHLKMRNYLVAGIVSAMFASVAYQVLAYVDTGYLAPLFIIALITTGIASFVISLLVGLPFLRSRLKRALS
jgi:hypothetical protein